MGSGTFLEGQLFGGANLFRFSESDSRKVASSWNQLLVRGGEMLQNTFNSREWNEAAAKYIPYRRME